MIAFGEERRVEAESVPVRARVRLRFQDSDDQPSCPTVLEDAAFGPLNLRRSPAEAGRRLAEATMHSHPHTHRHGHLHAPGLESDHVHHPPLHADHHAHD